MIARPETDEVYYTPLYYVLAQFSRYLRPDAVRIGMTWSGASPWTPERPEGPMATAFRNPDGRIVVVLLNQSDSDFEYAVSLDGRRIETSIAASAIQTLVQE